MPEGRPFDETRTPWRAWAPEQASRRLRDVRTACGEPIRWAVAGGWAIDLFLGRVTREHEDLEIVVLNDDVPAVLAAFAGPGWRWDGDEWMCRRDPSLRRPWSATVEWDEAGVPYLSPEIVLLFTAKHRRPKDEADLATALHALDEQRRAWLGNALDRVHPGHEWREQL